MKRVLKAREGIDPAVLARIVDALDRPAPAKCKKMARKRVLLQRLLRQQPLRPPGTRPPLGEISMGCNLSQALACDLTSEAPARPRPASLKAARSGERTRHAEQFQTLKLFQVLVMHRVSPSGWLAD